MGVFQASDRVASDDNVIADQLSRMEIEAALYTARKLGLRYERLFIEPSIRSMDYIAPTWPTTPQA